MKATWRACAAYHTSLQTITKGRQEPTQCENLQPLAAPGTSPRPLDLLEFRGRLLVRMVQLPISLGEALFCCIPRGSGRPAHLVELLPRLGAFGLQRLDLLLVCHLSLARGSGSLALEMRDPAVRLLHQL